MEKRTDELIELNERLRQEIEVRQRVEKDLQEAKRLLFTTFNALHDTVIVIDKSFHVRMSNWKGFDHISEKDRRGHPLCYDVFMQRKKPCSPCYAAEVFASGEIKEIEDRNPIDGKTRNIRVFPMFDDKGNVTTVIEHFRDITERIQATEALRKSEKRYRNLFNSLPIGLYRTTPEGSILDVNRAMVDILGYPDRNSLLQKNALESYVDPGDRKKFQALLEQQGFVKDFAVRLCRYDGRCIWALNNTTVAQDTESRMTYYEGAMTDITDRRESEERIHKLSQQLIEAHENERQMISRELHDRVAQDLSTLKILSETFFDSQPAVSSEIKEKVAEFSSLLDRTILTVRDLTYDLRPPGLSDMGLVAGLLMYCEEFSENSRLKVDFQAHGLDRLTFAFDTEINIYRLVQEGLNNIRKHAHAGKAIVRLVGSFPNIILRIEDDGKGFDVKERERTADSEKRMGLRSMAERVNLLRGQMKIQSRLNKGTKIEIKLPCQENTNDETKDHFDR